MLLEDRTLIEAPPERVFGFFDAMAQNYLRWHPDHARFEWRQGDRVAVGNTFYFEEVIAGRLLKKEVVFTAVEPGRFMAFAPTWWLMRLFLPSMTFETRPHGTGTEFVAAIRVRTGPVGARLNRREFDAVRQHMREEGENLKRLMEG